MLKMEFSKQTQPAIFVDNVTKSYTGGSPTLQNLTMNVDTGIVYGLLGSSGCGKTTLLSCILRLQEWDSGKITVLGVNISKGSPLQSSKVGYMPQECALQDYLTPNEIFLCYGYLYGMTKNKIEEKWEELSKLLGIQKLQKQKIGSLSGGQKRRVSLAVTLVHSPDLLILDEPTVGLDPLLRMRIWDYLHELVQSSRVTVLVTTHYVEELRRAHMVGVMRNCRLIVEQDPTSLMTSFETSLLEEAVLNACRKNEILNKLSTLKNNLLRNDLTSSLQIFPHKYNSEIKLMQKSPLSLVRVSCASQFDSVAETYPTPELIEEKGPSASDILFGKIYKLFMFAYFLELGILRDLRFCVIIVLLPIVEILSTVIVLGAEQKLLPFGVINNENLNWTKDCDWSTPTVQNMTNLNAGCLFIEKLSNDRVIDVIQFQDRKGAESAVSLGNIWGYLDIPEQFSQKLVERAAFGLFANDETINGTVIGMRMDNSNFVVSFTILSNIYKSLIDSFENLSQLKGINVDLDIPIMERFPGVYGHPNMTHLANVGAMLAISIPFQVTVAASPLILLNGTVAGWIAPFGVFFLSMLFSPMLSLNKIHGLKAIPGFGLYLEGTKTLNFVLFWLVRLGDSMPELSMYFVKRQHRENYMGRKSTPKERDNGVLQRIRLTGLRTIQFMMAITLALLPHAAISTLITYWCLQYGYGYEFYCPLITFLFQGILGSIAGFAYGLLAVVILGDMISCILVLTVTVPSLFFYMGLVRPFENLPKILQYISYYCFPLISLVESAKSTMNRGLALSHPMAWPGVMLTVAWIVVAFMVTILFRKRLYTVLPAVALREYT